ncbi:MAG: GNAT family N-acetyltransferase [Blastocatellia bacterium]
MAKLPGKSALKPLKQLVSRARDARGAHRDRHRPTGLGFALADSIDYLDAAPWDGVTAGSSVFLSRRYLRALEQAGPDNVRQRYALIFQGRQPVAALAAQMVTLNAAKLPKPPGRGLAKTVTEVMTGPLAHLEERMLVCGNLLSWGPHGMAIAPGADPAEIWPAAAEAIYRLRRADKLSGDTDLIMIKDLPDTEHQQAAALKRFSYRAVETEPNMVLELAPAWKTHDDYLASLTSNYRKTARSIDKKTSEAGGRIELLTDTPAHAATIHALYMQVHERQKLRLITLHPDFIPALAESFGPDFRCTVLKRDDQIAGFVTTLKDGDTAVGYYIGYDRAANADMPIYLRLLQGVIADAMQMGCRRVSLGRTALEPKARLGAKPVPLHLWMRHRLPAINVIVRELLRAIPHDDPPERNPFK